MKHKLIVFDWNGTVLADTIPSWKAGNDCLQFYGAQPITLAQYRDTFTFPVIHFYKLNGLSVDTVLAKKDEANTLFQARYEGLAARCRTRRGAHSLLSWLQDHKFSMIILSNYRTEKIQNHLKRLKIEHYFQHVDAYNCDGSTILQSATKTERLHDYMLKHGYKPQDVVIIGDTMEEPEIARHLSLISIGITDGYISRARLRHANPDHIINNLGEVRSFLEKMYLAS